MFRGDVDCGRMRLEDALEGGGGVGMGFVFRMERYVGLRSHLRGYEGLIGE